MAKQVCTKCGRSGNAGGREGGPHTSDFLPINNFLFDGFLPICNDCIETRIKHVYTLNNKSYWNFLNEFCQLLNIQFNPSLWEKLSKQHKYRTFIVYANMMRQTEYARVNWNDQNARFLDLQEIGELDNEVPELREAKVRKLQERWGANYGEEQLFYLENLYKGIISTQNVNGDLQIDNAKKICKISLMIEERIRASEDFDKLLASYDKLVKIADFSPKGARNASDFDSVGELFGFLEKRGWVNKFHDGETRDIVDETLKNIQNYNRSLFINETNMAEEIERRIEVLNTMEDFTDKYYEEEEMDYDNYEIEGQTFEEEY